MFRYAYVIFSSIGWQENVMLNWNFWRCGGFKLKNLPCGGMDNFWNNTLFQLTEIIFSLGAQSSSLLLNLELQVHTFQSPTLPLLHLVLFNFSTFSELLPCFIIHVTSHSLSFLISTDWHTLSIQQHRRLFLCQHLVFSMNWNWRQTILNLKWVYFYFV